MIERDFSAEFYIADELRQPLSSLCLKISRLERAIGHQCCCCRDNGEVRDHVAEIVSSIEAVFEVDEAPRDVFLVDCPATSDDRRLDIGERALTPSWASRSICRVCRIVTFSLRRHPVLRVDRNEAECRSC
ncbi:hypothetical protein [Methylosinus sp. C49]|uniref:hypothetical protein n=1 Tax=Methylosinus sp. C49 TaxID=2699395 RepID=UPI00137B645C|nr:hypothetical protein [Methylosinus sp. C49]